MLAGVKHKWGSEVREIWQQSNCREPAEDVLQYNNCCSCSLVSRQWVGLESVQRGHAQHLLQHGSVCSCRVLGVQWKHLS